VAAAAANRIELLLVRGVWVEQWLRRINKEGPKSKRLLERWNIFDVYST